MSRWSAYAWSHMREGSFPALARGGTLGGSQAGVKIAYRLAGGERPPSLYGRLASPLGGGCAEAALGLEIQPLAALPLRLAVERRQALGRGGRSDFAFLVHGGVDAMALPRGARLEGYGQAGMVGLEEEDLFADGALRITVPAGEGVRLGGGPWGAAQPGAARLDIGPSVSLDLAAAGRTMRLQADWRLRIAGDAAPASGPALTVATDF
ncbi:MAG: hypothetical protein ACFBQW_03245 [Sphingomonadaceae bacterium]